MKKRFGIIALLLAAVLAFSGCKQTAEVIGEILIDELLGEEEDYQESTVDFLQYGDDEEEEEIAELPTETVPPTTTEKETEPPTTTEKETVPPTTTEKETVPPTTTEKETVPPTTTEKETVPPTTTEEETEPVYQGITVEKNGEYTDKEHVALYIHTYGKLPSNYITKNEAEDLGWNSSKGNLWKVAPGKSIGGSYFGNYEGLLPKKNGRKYYECDIDFDGGYRNAKRIIYSNDGLVFYTEDHYETFEQLY